MYSSSLLVISLLIIASTTMALYFPPSFQMPPFSPDNNYPYPYFQTPPSSPSSNYGAPPPEDEYTGSPPPTPSHHTNYGTPPPPTPSHHTNYGTPPPPPSPAAANGNNTDQQEFTEEHNAARRNVTGVTLPPLAWDDALAAYASRYADERKQDCKLEHSKGPYGENIAEGTGALPAKQAVDLWTGEKSDYDYENNACAAGKVCGHYTQVVWKNTTHLGCARIKCDSGSVFAVCSYSPPGNYIGEKPY